MPTDAPVRLSFHQQKLPIRSGHTLVRVTHLRRRIPHSANSLNTSGISVRCASPVTACRGE